MSEQQKINVSRADFGFKGWSVCLYILFIYYLNTSMNTGWQNCLGYWQTNYGWDTTFLMSLVGIAQLFGIALCFVIGRLALKVSPRKLAIGFGIVEIISCFVIGNIHSSMLLFGIVEAIAVLSQVVWAYTLNPLFISTWFPRKKGIAMGIVTIGIPLGAGTASKIMNWIGNTFGFNHCIAYCGFIAIIGMILLLFIVRDTPEEAGCAPDNDTSLSMEDIRRMNAEAQQKEKMSPWTTVRVLSQKETYMIALSIGLTSLFAGGAMTTNIQFMLSIGIEIGTAVNCMMLTAATACVCSYLFGKVDARFGPRIGMIGVFICAILATLCNSLATSLPTLIPGLIMIGAVSGGGANFMPSLIIEYWGSHNFKRVYGVLYPIFQIPGSLGITTYSLLFALFGNFHNVYRVMMIFMVISFVVFLLVKDGSFVKRAESKWNE